MRTKNYLEDDNKYDAVLVGAGIMSSTLALLISELLPDIKILIVERLSSPGLESTGVFNNAGTGHAANCELNYTPMDEKGVIEIDKALSINNAFEMSLELWASLYESGKIDINKFLNFIPHISFVSGLKNTDYLYKRFKLMSSCEAFKDMEFSSSASEISDWAPLLIENRKFNENIAATRFKRGTDINFEALTREYLSYISNNKNVTIKYSTDVINLKRYENNQWELQIRKQKVNKYLIAKYVFLGAGGKSINLLQKSNIPESKLYGGFPVSGKWLICDKKELTAKHNAKVYGKADIGSPPMSVPHLDTRFINDKKYLLYGPFAGFTTKFLKEGSYFDLFRSFNKENILSIFDVGFKNIDLINYLISQTSQTHFSRINNLKNIMPSADTNDWYLKNAGQRVQIIKKTRQGGVLKFGTEVVNSDDGSISALLGASPGASTAVNIMIYVLKKSCLLNGDKSLLEKKICNLLPSQKSLLDLEEQKNIKRKNNEILGFNE